MRGFLWLCKIIVPAVGGDSGVELSKSSVRQADYKAMWHLFSLSDLDLPSTEIVKEAQQQHYDFRKSLTSLVVAAGFSSMIQ
jgi:hypothetical protein